MQGLRDGRKEMSKTGPLGIGGEPRPDVSKVEGLVHLRRDGGRRTMVRMYPHSPLGTEGEPHPNASKVEGLIHFKRDGRRGPDNNPYVPLQPIRNKRRISS